MAPDLLGGALGLEHSWGPPSVLTCNNCHSKIMHTVLFCKIDWLFLLLWILLFAYYSKYDWKFKTLRKCSFEGFYLQIVLDLISKIISFSAKLSLKSLNLLRAICVCSRASIGNDLNFKQSALTNAQKHFLNLDVGFYDIAIVATLARTTTMAVPHTQT